MFYGEIIALLIILFPIVMIIYVNVVSFMKQNGTDMVGSEKKGDINNEDK